MPIYEFRCGGCRRRFSALVGMVAEPDDLRCPHCGGDQAEKLVSRFARGRSEDDRLDEIAEQVERIGEPDSPAEMRRLMREMGKAMDDDCADEMEELLEEDLMAEDE